MIRNYLKIAYRNLVKNSLYSGINIGGLAIGMAVSFMLLLYVYNEFSYDKFNANSDRLYTVYRNHTTEGTTITSPSSSVPLAPALLKDIPEVEAAIRTDWGGSPVLITYKNKPLKIQTMTADASILDAFTFNFVSGNKKSALADPSSIVLTQTAAKQIFGDENPVGQVVKYDNKYPLTVTAVIKDNPHNSSFDFGAMVPWSGLEARQSWIKGSGWGNFSFLTYVMLKKGVSLDATNHKIADFIGHYSPDNKNQKIFLYPYTANHLYGDFKNGKNVGGAIEHVRLFLILAIGILLIACINFMNLSTARSEKRAREVGVRKAIGAGRFALIQQFMGESIFLALISLVLAVILMQVSLPYFDQIIHIQLSLPYNNVWAWTAALSVTLITGFVSGSYPAIFLSSFKPVKVLKGQLVSTSATVRPRQVLVVIQFVFAVCLILSSIFIYKQISYIKDRPIGYDRAGLIEMPDDGKMDNPGTFEAFRQEAIHSGAITDAAITSGSITDASGSSWGIVWPGQLPGQDKLPIDQIVVTWHFISTYNIEMAQGRDFEQSNLADSLGVILNESAVKLMNLKNPLGQQIKWQGVNHTVVGVTKDFVWGSPYEPVKPAIIGFMKGWTGSIGLRLNPAQSVSKNLATLQSVYKKYNPEFPFEYKFTDEKFAKKFANEQLLGTMSTSFTCLAIVISCLGLFGLAAFSAEQRRKEIGIRKVLGASISNLWFNLSQEFFKLVTISFVIGAALSWYFINGWLSKFTYHTDLSIWVFAATMGISLLICLVTVGWQAIKAALANPVKSLRSE